MGVLDDDMVRLVNEQRLGFVATVDEHGTPNLSPKGTMVVLDDEHLAFGENRSPSTIANLRDNRAIEINFVDATARRGYRFEANAEVFAHGEPGLDELRRAWIAGASSPSASVSWCVCASNARCRWRVRVTTWAPRRRNYAPNGSGIAGRSRRRALMTGAARMKRSGIRRTPVGASRMRPCGHRSGRFLLWASGIRATLGACPRNMHLLRASHSHSLSHAFATAQISRTGS